MIEINKMKYIWHADGSTELYDLKTDRSECNNLANAPEHMCQISSMHATLVAEMTKLQDPLANQAAKRRR